MNDSVQLSTPEHAVLEFELAGLGSRFLAHMIDLVLVGIVLISLWLFLFLGPWATTVQEGIFDGQVIGSYGVAILILISFAVLWGYYFLLEGFYRGTTPGKRIMGIRVLRDDGLPIGYYESAMRNLVRAADAFPPPTYLLAGIVIHLDPQGKRLGDMVAGTMVIRESFSKSMDSNTGASWSARVEKGQSRKQLSLPNGNVSVKQLDLIEQYLNRRTTFSFDQREKLAQSMAAPLWKLSGQEMPREGTASDIIRRDETFLQDLLKQASESSETNGRPNATTRETSFF